MASDYANVKLHWPLARKIDAIFRAHGYKSRSDFVQDAARRRLEELMKLDTMSKKHPSFSLSQEDKTFLEVIAQDHWAQFHSFEEEDVAESILANFKQDPEKPKNPLWLGKAIEFCCSLKRN